MNIKSYKILLLLVLIAGLNACGGGSTGTGTGTGSGSALTVPNEVTWVTPTQNTDSSALFLSKYRLFYGSDSNSLAWVFDIDTTGVTFNTHTISSAQKVELEDLMQNNSTHFFALKAVNSQNIESAFSNIAEYSN